MKIERQKLCNRLACVCDRYKQRIIEKTIMLAEEYPTQSPSWECLLSFKKGLYIFNPETREVVPFHILIIEDEEALALAMEDLIRSIPNVFVKSVGTGGLALNTIPLGFWDVVLLDIVMNAGDAGSIQYQYAANNGALNGVWLTQAQLKTISDITITNTTNSFKIVPRFNSNGVQKPTCQAFARVRVNVAANIGGISKARLINSGGF